MSPILLLTLLAAADVAVPLDESTNSPFAVPETELAVPALELEDGWIELTHLRLEELPPVVYDLDRRGPDDEPLTLRPPLPPGPTMVCSGGRGFGVLCEEIYRGAGELVAPARVEIAFEPGLEVRGVYRQDSVPVAGARVAVVPAGVEAPRAFTLPLVPRDGGADREVVTDEDGRFVVPEIAPGDYFLETLLPSGRVHRSDPFTLPDRVALHRFYEVDEREPGELFWDLDRIDVPTGLDVTVRALDPAGEPLPGTVVAATQGRTPRELLDFEATADGEGFALLHGLDVDLPVRLSCARQGYRPHAEEHELLPVTVDCVLEPWARVTGEVIGPDGQPPPGAVVALRPAGTDVEPRTAAAAGAFELDELAAGDYELRVAAPGHRVEERALTVDAGQHLELGPIALLHAREVEARVVDAGSGEPIAGVDVRAVWPPGAVDTYSDLDGELRFGAPGAEGLVLEFSVFDYATRRLALTPADLEPGELTVELAPAGWILAQVEDAAGGPCRGCRLVLWPGGEELWTDGRGEALSGPLAEGVHRVARPRVAHLGSTVIEEPDAETFRVRVRPGRLSIVRLASGGRPVAVRFEPGLDGWTLSARSRLRAERVAGDDGRFEIRQRPGETLDLFLHAWDPELETEIAIWQATLPAGSLADELSVRLSGSEVHGRVTDLEGPLPGAEVRLLGFADAELRAFTATLPDGTFRIPHVRPGVYNLYVGPRSVRFVGVGERQSVDVGTFQVSF